MEIVIGLVVLVILTCLLLGLVAFIQVIALRRQVASLRKEMTTFRREAARSDHLAQTRLEDAIERALDGAPRSPPKPNATAASIARIPEASSDPVEANSPRQPPPAGSSHGGIGGSRPTASTFWRSVEDHLGARWAVWMGGLALVLGGMFLVRYSIDMGLLPPVVRVSLGVLLGLVLLGAGEWLRRHNPTPMRSDRPYIPGILTLAGITAVFAATFAAHALYSLIGPASAFLVLGVVALLTMIAAVLHGPALASAGLLACYVVPFLVSSGEASIFPLAIYGLAVSIAAYSVARIRQWRWLAAGGAAGSVCWAHLLAIHAEAADTGKVAAFILASLIVAGLALVLPSYRHPLSGGGIPATRTGQDWTTAAILSVHLLPLLVLLQIDGYGTASLVALTVGTLGVLIMAAERPPIASAALGAGTIAALGFLGWDLPSPSVLFQDDLAVGPALAEALTQPATGAFLKYGTALGFAFAAVALRTALLSESRWAVCAAGFGLPVAIYGIAWLRISSSDLETVFGVSGLGMAAGYALVIGWLDRKLDNKTPHKEATLAAACVACVAALISATSMLLADGWLVISMGTLSAAIAWVELRFAFRTLRWLSVVSALVCLGVILADPAIVGTALGTSPVMNWLLPGYGVPAASFAYAAWLMHFRQRDLPQQIMEALAILAALSGASLLIHHAMNSGDLFAPVDGMAERSLFTLLALSAALALQHLGRRAGGSVLDLAAMIIGVAGFAWIAVGHIVLDNPLFTGESVGSNWPVNKLFPAYLLPAIMAGTLAWLSYQDRPRWYWTIAAGLAFALIFMWITLLVRSYFQPVDLSLYAPNSAELYAYSAVWLAFGVLLLALSLLLGSRTMRLASAAIITLTVAKVFVVDMSNLEGALRALSFIGLGIALIGIGHVYQCTGLTGRTSAPQQAGTEG